MAGIYHEKAETNILKLSQNNNVFYVPEVIGGRYDVKEILAYGGLGVIFKAKDRRLFGKDVLIKAPYVKEEFFKERDKATEKYIEECKNNIELEATILTHLQKDGLLNISLLIDKFNGPNIGILGPHGNNKWYFENLDKDGLPFWQNSPHLVLNYIKGMDLNQNLKQLKPQIRPKVAKKVVLNIGRTLAACHKERTIKNQKISFIYQDLKPSNIIFSNGIHYLIDFGGATYRVNKSTSKNNIGIGTPGYKAPEYNTLEYKDIDERVDLFSLGATVFEILTGNKPKADVNNEAVFDYSLLDATPKWKSWVMTATEKDRNYRFSTIYHAIKNVHGINR